MISFATPCARCYSPVDPSSIKGELWNALCNFCQKDFESEIQQSPHHYRVRRYLRGSKIDGNGKIIKEGVYDDEDRFLKLALQLSIDESRKDKDVFKKYIHYIEID